MIVNEQREIGMQTFSVLVISILGTECELRCLRCVQIGFDPNLQIKYAQSCSTVFNKKRASRLYGRSIPMRYWQYGLFTSSKFPGSNFENGCTVGRDP